jgi:hypothetical protein
MPSDPDHVRDEEIVTVDAEGQAGTAPPRDSDSTDTGDRVDTGDATDQTDLWDVTDQAEAEAALSGAGDTGVMMDAADSGTIDQSDVPTPGGAGDTGVMMDAADSGALDRTDVVTPSGASDTGAMMDSRDTGTVDRTDVGERGDADADESDR